MGETESWTLHGAWGACTMRLTGRFFYLIQCCFERRSQPFHELANSDTHVLEILPKPAAIVGERRGWA